MLSKKKERSSRKLKVILFLSMPYTVDVHYLILSHNFREKTSINVLAKKMSRKLVKKCSLVELKKSYLTPRLK